MLSLAIIVPVVLLAAAIGIITIVRSPDVRTTAAAATPNPNCTLIVPANPLTAQGLSTAYQLTATDAANGPCNEANANQGAFAEAAIITTAGQVTLYDPLVIDKGTQPASPIVPAQVPAGSTVAIWFGFNGTNLTLQSAAGTNSLTQGACVNGLGNSLFTQEAMCNAPAFFKQANAEIQSNTLQIPATGTAKDGQPCPTTRSFSLVDQDQSDNVVTQYLANGNGQTAQNNAASLAAIGAGNAVDLNNGSDNLLLDKFVDPALGCTPVTKPDVSSDGQASGALPLDELSAAANQQAPIALVPLNDPMTMVGNNTSVAKTNLYRVNVDQLPIGGGGDNGSGATYCQNMFGTPGGVPRVFTDMAIFQNAPSVDAAMATNLFTFLAMRANQSYTNLGCQALLNNDPNPITLTMNGNGVVTAATFTPLGQTPPAAGCGTTTTTTSAMPTTTTAAATTTTAAATSTTTGAATTTTAAAGGGTTTTTAAAGGGTTTTTAGATTTTGAAATTTPAATTTTTGMAAPTTTAGATTTTTCSAGATTTSSSAAATTTTARGSWGYGHHPWGRRPHW